MKIKPSECDAKAWLELTRAEAFEVLAWLASELANEENQLIQVAIFDDDPPPDN